MSLTSPRFSGNNTLQNASRNSPPLRAWSGDSTANAIIQRALVDLGYSMPRSTRPDGSMDGIFGRETVDTVRQFQRDQGLTVDGAVGRNTMGRLDQLLPTPSGGPPVPTTVSGLPYVVPGFRHVVAQPSSMTCWATVYTMMRSWKDQTGYPIADAVGLVAPRYRTMFNNNQGMPSSQFGAFCRAAGIQLEPMMNLTMEAWLDHLHDWGLLWVGALNSTAPGAGLHSRIVEGMRGDGTRTGTNMMIIDPAGGRRYGESFGVFQTKYEGAISGISGQYFQIRHF